MSMVASPRHGPILYTLTSASCLWWSATLPHPSWCEWTKPSEAVRKRLCPPLWCYTRCLGHSNWKRQETQSFPSQSASCLLSWSVAWRGGLATTVSLSVALMSLRSGTHRDLKLRGSEGDGTSSLLIIYQPWIYCSFCLLTFCSYWYLTDIVNTLGGGAILYEAKWTQPVCFFFFLIFSVFKGKINES